MAVTKNFLIFSLLTALIGFGQNLNTDTTNLSNASKSLLKTKIDFDTKGGTLDFVLNELSFNHDLKFSYAGQQTHGHVVKKQSLKSSTIETVLQSILYGTPFDYVVVGRMVVVVKKKVPPNTIVNKPDSSKSASQNPKTAQNQTHIYNGNHNSAIDALPWSERRRIYKTFKKEWSWSLQISKSRKNSDSTQKPIKEKPIDEKVKPYNFVLATMELDKSFSMFKNNLTGWKKELSYKQRANVTMFPEMAIGRSFQNLMLSIGLSYKNITTKSTWLEYRRANDEFVNKTVDEKYRIISIPLQATLYQTRQQYFYGAGATVRFNFIQTKKDATNKLNRYYEDKVVGDDYKQKVRKVAFSTSLFITAGLLYKDNLIFSGSLEYEPYLTPLTTNSVYSLYPQSLSFRLGALFFFKRRK